MALNKLNILVEDLNGEHAFTNLKAQFGYILPFERLQVTRQVLDLCANDNTAQRQLRLSHEMFLHLLYLNFTQLKLGQVTDDAAIRMAFLRAKWIKTGNLLATSALRCTPIDEVDVVVAPGGLDFINADGTAHTNEAGELIGHARHNAFLRAFNNMNFALWNERAPILWAITAHVFRVRGHHYKDELEDLYARTWAGTTMDLPDRMLTWSDIGRRAIHSFGVKALERSTAFYATQNALTTNLLLRRTAIPCGSAAIGTAYAALMQFQSTPYYGDLAATYGPQIEALRENYRQVIEAGVGAHISAGLYGVDRIVVQKDAANALAPILVGYIRATPANTAIRQQRSLDILADTNPMMMDMMRVWLTSQTDKVGERTSLASVLGRADAYEEE